MVVTINRIMFSGDESQKKPSFMDKLAKRLGIGTSKEEEVFYEVPVSNINQSLQIKNKIEDNIAYTNVSLVEHKTKLKELNENLVIATKKKQKETIKFIKQQIRTTKLVIEYSHEELKKYEAILTEQN